MGRATTALYEHENSVARRREDDARAGRQAYNVAAEKTARVFGRNLTPRESDVFGNMIHWGLGAGIGALYGALRQRVPSANAGIGTLFGTAFWLAIDEGANTALGLTPAPTEFPWQAHARGLAGHLVYGLVAETTLQVTDRILH
jgi:uncharacterized membrane protein YagU involved in acid resistance